MTYEAAIQYLYEKLPMFQRVGAAAYKKDLGNTLRLLEGLGNPHHSFRSVHVAGTNGKGSVSNMIAAGLQINRIKTGLYTSPHLVSFTERIRINGVQIPESDVIDFVLKTKDLIEEIQPSFFEATVAMAFRHFAQKGVEMAVVEVGMGGRLDSTNVITPDLCVITNIHYDHAEHLGDTLEKIAGEKAGIIKKGVPVIIGRTQAETEPVFLQKVQELGSPIMFADQNWSVIRKSGDLQHQIFEIRRVDESVSRLLTIDLPGLYQLENVRTVLEVFHQLRKIKIPLRPTLLDEAVGKTKSLTGFKGRMTQLGDNPLVLCDVGHNEDGVRAVLAQLAGMDFQQLHLVWGMVNDKDVSKILAMLPKDASYYFVRPDVPRGRDAQELATQAAAVGLKGEVYGSVQEGLEVAKMAAGKDDLIFVGGSTFVVAEVV